MSRPQAASTRQRESRIACCCASEPAVPVQGSPAYWLSAKETTSLVTLAWQWTLGAWAIVEPVGVEERRPAAELHSIATQVAQQLAFGAATPLTAPFSLPMPDGMYPAMTLTMKANVYQPQLLPGFYFGFDTVGKIPPAHMHGYVPDLWVNASAFMTISQLPAAATPYAEDLGFPLTDRTCAAKAGIRTCCWSTTGTASPWRSNPGG